MNNEAGKETMYFASHRIPTDNLGRLEQRVKQLNKKVAKNRVTTGSLITAPQHEEIVKIGVSKSGRDVFRSYTWVTFFSETDFSLEGYNFVARYDFERDVDGNSVVYAHAMPGEEIPAEFKETDGHCDHCNTRRYRKNTFLVRDPDGAYKIFGRACLSDIFPVSAAAIASLFELVRNPGSIAGDLDEEYRPGMKMTHYDRNEGVLGWAVSIFNQSGFISKAVARDQDREATADTVAFIMADSTYMSDIAKANQKELIERYRPTDEVKADVELLIKLIADAEVDGDYIEKLQKVIAQGHVSAQNFNILVSAVSILRKHRQTEERAEAVKDVPDVIEGRYELTGEIVSFREEPGFGYYDDPVMKCLIKDAEGRKYWGTYPRALADPSQGDRVTLTATVSQGKDDSKFGIFKRPSKAVNLTAEADNAQERAVA
jgi:hypothetical protein